LCFKQPLSHSLRIVGFNALQQPVLYTAFSQAHSRRSLAHVMDHLTYELETAARIMRKREQAGIASAERWVLFFDFAGYSLLDNNPAPGYAAAKLMNHYPERLATAIMYDAPAIFGHFYRLVHPMLNEETASKIRFVPAGSDLLDTLNLGDELAQWLRSECAENRRGVCAGSGNYVTELAMKKAKRYWDRPANELDHDPRGPRSFRESDWFVLNYAPDSGKHPEKVKKAACEAACAGQGDAWPPLADYCFPCFRRSSCSSEPPPFQNSYRRSIKDINSDTLGLGMSPKADQRPRGSSSGFPWISLILILCTAAAALFLQDLH
jgi:hypothetical protein